MQEFHMFKASLNHIVRLHFQKNIVLGYRLQQSFWLIKPLTPLYYQEQSLMWTFLLDALFHSPKQQTFSTRHLQLYVKQNKNHLNLDLKQKPPLSTTPKYSFPLVTLSVGQGVLKPGAWLSDFISLSSNPIAINPSLSNFISSMILDPCFALSVHLIICFPNPSDSSTGSSTYGVQNNEMGLGGNHWIKTTCVSKPQSLKPSYIKVFACLLVFIQDLCFIKCLCG